MAFESWKIKKKNAGVEAGAHSPKSTPKAEWTPSPPSVPAWRRIYEGLSDADKQRVDGLSQNGKVDFYRTHNAG
jgi:hypothetical protein